METWIWIPVLTVPVVAAALGFFIEGGDGSGLIAGFVLGLYSLLLLLPVAFLATNIVLGWTGKKGVLLAIPLLFSALLAATLLVNSFYDPEPGRLSRFMAAIVTTACVGILLGKTLRLAHERKNGLPAAATGIPITLGLLTLFYVTAARLSSPLAYSPFDEESLWGPLRQTGKQKTEKQSITTHAT